MKLLILIPNLGSGGAQRVFRQQMRCLSVHFNVLGCVFNWDGSFEDDKVSNIISLNVPGGKTWVLKVYYFIIRIIRLRSLKRRYGIDVSISHLEGADYVNLLSCSSAKEICWIHGTKKFDGNISGMLGLIRFHILMPLVYRRAKKIVTVSAGIRDEFRKNFKGIKDRVEVIYNGFDVEYIKNRSSESVDKNFEELCQQSKIVITHCRLSKQKNLVTLLYIFNELVDQNLKLKDPPDTSKTPSTKKVYTESSLKLVIVGAGELQDELVETCKKLNLNVWASWIDFAWNASCDVYFLGHQQNPYKYLRNASLYIMTSNWEGFPLALCEALVCRLPAMASDCYTGPREILSTELVLPQPLIKPHYATFGILMPLAKRDTGSIKVWAKEVQRLLENRIIMDIYKKKGIERIKEYNLDSTIMKTVELIRVV